ncbi:MAG: leucine--tRNA ligase [Candidatus Jorgensenbacteria bacterium]
MQKYDFRKIEKKWQEFWQKSGVYEPDIKNAKRPFYNLMMFPYPSAEGLHVGNMYAFTGADIYGRMKRMEGYDVFQPIGLDGFGIHSENYALKIGAHPMEQAKVSEKRFYEQLRMIGNGFAWNEKLETYDPEYYKWTQWIFVEMFKHGLAYRKKAPVNWCPSCKTVLADEQVILRAVKNDPEQVRGIGVCERCETPVIKKELEQWFFRITKYADKLLDNLEKIDWSERVKIAQRNWIGRSEGASIKFSIFNSQFSVKEIEVFTTRPDTLFGATFMVISPELAGDWAEAGWKAPEEVEKYIAKALKNRSEEQKEKTGVFTGIYAANPATKKEIPVWVSDYVLAGYGTGAIMAVPAHDERDFDFAKKFRLPIVKVVEPPRIVPESVPGQAVPDTKIVSDCWAGEGELVNSGKFDGMDSEKARTAITKFVSGESETRYRLRDWLISRQRYWGPPIPMIYCEKCAYLPGGQGWQPVPEEDLPVLLPFVKDFRPKGGNESPLASVKSFYETKCPKCGGKARRETDVSDTFLDSAWYYLRYPSTRSVRRELVPWDPGITKKWLPAGLYTGGAEHSVLHLLYVRFLALALHDLKLLEFGKSDAPKGEPFPKFRAHGLLIKEGVKMSKSKGNVVNPDEYIKKFGADTLRMYLVFLAPFEQGGDFRDSGILGIERFLNRIWNYFGDINFFFSDQVKTDSDISKVIHQTIKKVTEDIESLSYNTAISQLMILLNTLAAPTPGKYKGAIEVKLRPISKEDRLIIIKLLAPFAPHIAEELWEKSGNEKSIHKEKWPEYSSKLIREENFELVIQINGKVRATVSAERGLSQKEAEKLALNNDKISGFLGGKKPKKVVFVPDRLINFVV